MPNLPATSSRIWAFLLLALTPAIAAQTYIVDAANGPGTHFTNLPGAITAVPDGATLLVRPGSYSGFTMSGKGLTVLGTGAIIQGTISIGGTAPNQGVTLRGLSWATVPTSTVIALTNCQGPVLLEDITQPANAYQGLCTPPCPIATGLIATSCQQLYLRHCTMLCTASINSSSAVLEACTIRGESFGQIYLVSAPFANYPRTALSLLGSDVQICGPTHCEGGFGGGNLGLGNFVDGADGIYMLGGSLRVLDGTIRAGGVFGASQAYSIKTTFGTSLRISPRTVLWGALSALASLEVMPALLGHSAAAGGVLTATTATENGDLVVLAVGLPGPAVIVPGFADPFWLEPTAHVFLAIGTQQPSAPIGGSVTVPAGPTFVGLRLNWQAACLGPATGSQASNPVVTVVH